MNLAKLNRREESCVFLHKKAWYLSRMATSVACQLNWQNHRDS